MSSVGRGKKRFQVEIVAGNAGQAEVRADDVLVEDGHLKFFGRVNTADEQGMALVASYAPGTWSSFCEVADGD